MIQQQCSERRTQTGREEPPSLRSGSAVFYSDNAYGRFLREQLDRPQDIFAFSINVRHWIRQHFLQLIDAMGPGDTLIFTGEMFSSEEVPELTIWQGNMPSSLVRHYVSQGRALPASNPAALLRLLQRDLLLGTRLQNGTWTNTFAKMDEAGIYHLLYTLEWRKATATQAQAA